MLLQCQTSTDATVILLKWIRPDLRSQGFVFFVRENHDYTSYQHPSFHGRVELRHPEMKDGDVSVMLKNVRSNDTGTYECHVGHGSSPELLTSISLNVTDSGELELKLLPGSEGNITHQMFDRCSHLLLTCRRHKWTCG